jgi:hypothetical protein
LRQPSETKRAGQPVAQPLKLNPLGGKRLSDGHKAAAFSNVVLTLISIIIALGIEHLLGHVSALLPEADRARAFLVAAQGVTTFLVIGAIWLAYATQLMTAGWEPRFRDFYSPLLILSLLYFWISAIGTNGPSWFYFSTVGFGVAAFESRFGLPDPVAERLKPRSPIASRSTLSLFGLCLLALGAGAATQFGAFGTTGATVIVCVMGVVQLFTAWSQYRWWRAA